MPRRKPADLDGVSSECKKWTIGLLADPWLWPCGWGGLDAIREFILIALCCLVCAFYTAIRVSNAVA